MIKLNFTDTGFLAKLPTKRCLKLRTNLLQILKMRRKVILKH